MQWLIHGRLTGAVAEALRRLGHITHTPQELLEGGAAGRSAAPLDWLELLAAAQKRQWDVLTNDEALVGAVFAKRFAFNRVLVYLQLSGGEVEQDDAIDRLFQRYKRLSPRRLYTVTARRVKVRQLPTGRAPRAGA